MPPESQPQPLAPTPPPAPAPVSSLSSPQPLVQTPPPSPPIPPAPAPVTPPSGDDDVKPLWRRTLSFLVSWVLIPGLLVFIVHNFVFQAWYVEGESMQPTFHNGDYLIVSKLETTWHRLTNSSDKLDLHRGQVVIFKPPTTEAELFYIKRVIGLPGDRVVVSNGTIKIYNDSQPNGFTLDETYTGNVPIEGEDEAVIGAGEVYVVGDNRNHDASLDSRILGPIPTKRIVGTASLRLLPTSQFGGITAPNYDSTRAASTPSVELTAP